MCLLYHALESYSAAPRVSPPTGTVVGQRYQNDVDDAEMINQHRDSVATPVGIDCPIPRAPIAQDTSVWTADGDLVRFRRISSTLQFPDGTASVMESMGHGRAHYVVAQELDLELHH